MKITMKTEKNDIIELLKVNAGAVKSTDAELYNEMVYMSDMLEKDDSKVSKTDLALLAKKVIKSLGADLVEPQTTTETTETTAENSVKKLKKAPKKDSKKDSKTVQNDKEEPKADDKKSTKKAKKDEPVVTVLENPNTGEVVVKAFAKEFQMKNEDGSTTVYTRADDIKDMKDLLAEDEKSSEDENLVFALYWSKRDLKTGRYINSLPTIKKPKEFPQDIDLATMMWVSDVNIVTYLISTYTEACYAVIPEFLEEFEGVRYIGDIEYQIYRAKRV